MMVYSIGSKSIYEFMPNMAVKDAPDDILLKTQFQDPDSLPPRTIIPGRLQMAQGYPVMSETVHNKMVWEHKTLCPPDVWGFDIKLVSEQFKRLVENFEPGKHQFIPVDLYRPEKDAPFEKYYWFVVCTVIDSVDPEHTTLTWDGDYESRRGKWHFDVYAVPPQKYVFSLKAIGDQHVWRDPYTDYSLIYCSDAFSTALLESNLTGVSADIREQI